MISTGVLFLFLSSAFVLTIVVYFIQRKQDNKLEISDNEKEYQDSQSVLQSSGNLDSPGQSLRNIKTTGKDTSNDITNISDSNKADSIVFDNQHNDNEKGVVRFKF